MLRSNYYDKDKEFRARRMREVQRDQLADQVTGGSKLNMGEVIRTHRRIFTVLAGGLVITLLLVLPHVSSARDMAMNDPGTQDVFAEAMTEYRVGHYFFVKGDYDRAVEEYTSAIAGIPDAIFAHSADYAMMYWDLGDAQFMAGQNDDALVSYQQYLTLVGEEASEEAVAYVQSLSDAITNNTVAQVTLITLG